MSGRLIVLLAAAALALPWAVAPTVPAVAARAIPPVRVVWVESRHERLSPAEAGAVRAQVGEALRYWRELAGVPLPTTWAEHWHYVDDPFADWRWLRPLNDRRWLTLAIVPNRHGRQVSLGGGVGAYGYSIPGGAALFCATHGDLLPGAQNAGLCVAHELGHYLGLPEGGPERDGRPASIMRDLVTAWREWEMHPLDRAGVAARGR